MLIDPFGKVRPRKPSLGRLLTMDTTRGVQRVRLWPSKRGPGRTPAERERAEKFRVANIISKYLPGIIQAQVRAAVQGTPLMPRDLLLSILYGRFAAIGMADGRKLYPLTARSDISESIDIVAQLPGMILFRGPDFWQGLEIGEPGQFLAVQPDGETLGWQDPPSLAGIWAAASFHWDGAAIITEGASNVDTITRISAGIYEVKMTNAASDADYVVLAGGRWPFNPDTIGMSGCLFRQFTPTSDTFQVQTFYNGSNQFDPEQVFFIVIDLNA